MAHRISVVINTLNEERNLPYALASVRSWVDEIIVVDMHSNDRTVEIARAHGARVYLHPPCGVVEPARGFAVGQATGDWILILDADELVPAPLSATLREIVRNDAADAVSLPWVNYLLGAPLMHAGWGPLQDRHIRFMKRALFRPDPTIHAVFEPDSGARVLSLSYRPGYGIIHFSYLDIAHLMEKSNRYTTVEAEQAHARGERAKPWRTLVRATKEFLRRYVRQQGYRDGWRGFYLSLLMAADRVAADGKLIELERNGFRTAVSEAYRAKAQRVLEGYAAAEAPDAGGLKPSP